MTHGKNNQPQRNRMKLLQRNENTMKATFSSPVRMLITHLHISSATKQLQVVTLRLTRVRRKRSSLNVGMIYSLKAKKQSRFSTWNWKRDWTISWSKLSCCRGWRSTHNSWERNKALQSWTKSRGRSPGPLPEDALTCHTADCTAPVDCTRRLNHHVGCRTALLPWKCTDLQAWLDLPFCPR